MRWVWHVRGTRKAHTETGGGTSEKEPTRKTLGIVKRMLIKQILKEIRWDGVNWFDLVQDKDKCRALLNATTRLLIP